MIMISISGVATDTKTTKKDQKYYVTKILFSFLFFWFFSIFVFLFECF
jgi:hypothetical protein